MDVLTGVVKWFHEAKGYGFLAADGIDYFAHYKAIVGEGYKLLKEGQTVTFNPKKGDKGMLAENIMVVANPPS